MLVPVMVMNMLAVRWGGLPTPWLPYTSFPGFALAYAISSLSEFTGRPLRTITRLGTDPKFVIGTNSSGLEGHSLWRRPERSDGRVGQAGYTVTNRQILRSGFAARKESADGHGHEHV